MVSRLALGLNGMFAKLFVGTGRGVPWPVSPQAVVGKNIDFHVDDLNNFQGASHFQAFDDARIKLGRGVWIARGCALITTNHDLMNPDLHTEPRSIELGDHCWLGTNVVITPRRRTGPSYGRRRERRRDEELSRGVLRVGRGAGEGYQASRR